MRDNTQHYRELFLDDIPLMDVRAPVEYHKGAFPNTVNRPLMNDIERQKVGTSYKQHGQQAAIALGHELVCGALKAERLAAWKAFAEANPNGYLYCFRGGLRSQIVQQWLKQDAGIDYPRVIGGYKALRNFLFETTRAAVDECDFVLVGGLTGCGKTEVIAALDNSLDLEGHANHRGSSFGRRATPQPAQIDFENRLAIDILKKRHRGVGQFVLEDEGRIVGSCSLPLELYQGMQGYPLVWLEDAFEQRVERILRDYVIDLRSEFERVVGVEEASPPSPPTCRRASPASSSASAASATSGWRRSSCRRWKSRAATARWIPIAAGSRGCSRSTTTRCTPSSGRARKTASSSAATRPR